MNGSKININDHVIMSPVLSGLTVDIYGFIVSEKDGYLTMYSNESQGGKRYFSGRERHFKIDPNPELRIDKKNK
jgi:hypothetical protein